MNPGLVREFKEYSGLTSHAFIVSGIRRCGKSTLLQQMHRSVDQPSIFLNFEDPRLAGFDLSDLNRLQEIAEKHEITTWFFDEIQNVAQWESFVRFRLDEGNRVFITGSNASLLSKELGTKLTGRHITKELFPFSYAEYLAFKDQKSDTDSSEAYLKTGGFPEYLKTGLSEILMYAFNDIIVRDIALRYNLKNSQTVQRLAVWLISNVGKPISGNSLRKLFDISSSSSIMDYLSYFIDAYLFFFIPRFSYSPKVRLVNPKKIYCIDNGFINVNSISFSDDQGRLLENMVFLHLRRQTSEIYYYSEKKECDFLVKEKAKITEAIQVCYDLNKENRDREINGLIEALEKFKLKEGLILTHDQEEEVKEKGKTIIIKPVWKWLLENDF